MTDQKIGKYINLEKLGKGGMGNVYKATDPIIGRTVTVKTIRFDVTSGPEEQDEATKRFVREAQSVGNLNHPNIVTIYDVGKDEGLMYIAMEYIEGKTLEELIADRKTFPLDKIVNWISQIGQALDYAHSKGITHRDIKPGNILIDKEEIPHVVDFGIARIATSTLTMTGTSLGTPSYMSPEQIAGKKVDFSADIFSLGTILYELLTLEKAFPGDSFSSIVNNIMNEEPPPVQNFNDQIPDRVDLALRKALAKKVDQRYQSCQQLADDLKNMHQSTSIPHKEPVDRSKNISSSLSRQPQKSSQKQENGTRKKPVVIALLASLMLLVVGIAAVLYFFVIKPKNYTQVVKPGVSQLSQNVDSIKGSTNQPERDKFQEALEAAQSANDNQDFPEVIKQSEIVLSQNPTHVSAMKLFLSAHQNVGLNEFNKGNYQKSMEHMQNILKFDPDNNFAQNYLETARKKIREQRIASQLKRVQSTYQQMKYEETIQEAGNVLKIDPKNQVAMEYIDLAKFQLTPQKLNEMVKRYVESVKNKRLDGFYKEVCDPSLYERVKKEASTLFTLYSDIQIVASNASIQFKDSAHAEVSFSHFITGIAISTGQRVILSERAVTWTMENISRDIQRDNWKILNIR